MFFPIFYTFAEEFNMIMKYLKVTFNVCRNGEDTADGDNTLLQAARDLLCQAAGAEAGFEAFDENEGGLTGYVQQKLFDGTALDACLKELPLQGINVSYTVSEAENRNWNKAWEDEGFEPINVDGRCVIHDAHHRIDVPKGVADITIDAKQAFGTGNHETTRMIVSELADTDLKGKRVLDCGCGTGILSIAAAKFGAAEAVGYDIDEWSVENTKHNCELNGTPNVSVALGDAGAIRKMGDKFDVVAANINRNILLADMPEFRAAMTDGALLLLSGFYEADAPMLTDRAAGLGLELVKKHTLNGWCMLVLRAVGG